MLDACYRRLNQNSHSFTSNTCDPTIDNPPPLKHASRECDLNIQDLQSSDSLSGCDRRRGRRDQGASWRPPASVHFVSQCGSTCESCVGTSPRWRRSFLL